MIPLADSGVLLLDERVERYNHTLLGGELGRWEGYSKYSDLLCTQYSAVFEFTSDN